LYTGASGMMVQQQRLNTISNNLANVNTTGYKRDLSVQKAFPQMLLRRMNDDGQMRIPYRSDPFGSTDSAPVVGKLGTGVEQNEVYTVFNQGELRQTKNPFDLGLEGDGFFAVQTPNGERYTRNGSFHIDPSGTLVTKQGYPVLTEDGPIQVQSNNFHIDKEGQIFRNAEMPEDRPISQQENTWQESEQIGQLRLVNVREPRYLEKEGDTMYKTTEHSGPARAATGDERPVVHQGFLENANVNPVSEMTQMIEVNRAYEANQRVIRAQDESAGLLINQVMTLT
jgi:flagellar basal-body rod protein FlgG